MADVLIKPSNANPVTGDIDRTGTPVIPIKARRITSRYVAPLFETTGGNDSTPQWENAELIYSEHTIFGFMLTDTSLDPRLTFLDNQTPGDATTTPPFSAGGIDGWDVTINYADSDHSIALKAIIESVDFDWVKNTAAVSVIIRIRTTDWNPVDIT